MLSAITSDIRFQSTPSVWRETFWCEVTVHFFLISIHSLRVEGDDGTLSVVKDLGISIHSLRVEGDHYHTVIRQLVSLDFNPLPPCGGRRADTMAM